MTLQELLKPIQERVSKATPERRWTIDFHSLQVLLYYPDEDHECIVEVTERIPLLEHSHTDIERLIKCVEVLSESLHLVNSDAIQSQRWGTELYSVIEKRSRLALSQAESILRGENNETKRGQHG